MRTSGVTLRGVLSAIVTLAITAPTGVMAGPAQPNQGNGCLVRDANMIQYFDPDCSFHEVFKYESKSDDLTLLHYQDHGKLPPGAALPTQA